MIQTSSMLKTAVAKDGTLFYADNKVLYCSSNGADIDYSYTYSSNNYTVDMIIAYERYVFIFNKMSSYYETVTVFDTETKTHKSTNQSGYVYSYCVIDQYLIVKHYYDSTTSYYYAYDLMNNSKIYLGLNLTVAGLLGISGTTNHHVTYEKLDNVTYYYYTLELTTSTASALTFKITKYLFSALNKTITTVSFKTHTIAVSNSAGVCYYDLYTPERFVVNSQNLGAFVCNTSSSVAEYSLNASLAYVKAAITPQDELVTLFYTSSTCYLYKDQSLLKDINIKGISSNPSFQKVTNYIGLSYYDKNTVSNCVDRIVVSIQKQKGYKVCTFTETVLNGDVVVVDVNESIIAAGNIILPIQEPVIDMGAAIIETSEKVIGCGVMDLSIIETIDRQYQDYKITTTTLDYEITAIEREGNIILARCSNKDIYVSQNNGISFVKLKAYNYSNVCMATNGVSIAINYYDSVEKVNKIDIWDAESLVNIKTLTGHGIIESMKCTENYLIGYDSDYIYTYDLSGNICKTIKCKNVCEINQVKEKLVFNSFSYAASINTQYNDIYLIKQEYDFSNNTLNDISSINTTINTESQYSAIYYISEEFVAAVDNTIKIYNLKTGEKIKEINENAYNDGIVYFMVDNQNDLITCFDSLEGKTMYIRVFEDKELIFTEEKTTYTHLAAIDNIAKTYMTISYGNKIVTMQFGGRFNPAGSVLTLLEVVSDIDKPILPIIERVSEICIQDVALKENIVAGGITLSILEDIKRSFYGYNFMSLKETVQLPDVHLSYLELFEKVNFKLGEFGAESIIFPVQEIVETKPSYSLNIKEELVDKPPVRIVLTNLEGYIYQDEFCGKADPMFITHTIPLTQKFTLAAPDPLFEEIRANSSDYNSYGYKLTASIAASTKKRYLLIPKVSKIEKEVGLFDYTYADTNERYIAYQVTKTGLANNITAQDLRVYNSKTGIVLECEIVSGYSNYLCYKLPQQKQEIRIEPEFGYAINFAANSLKIATYDQSEDTLPLSEYTFAYQEVLPLNETITSHCFYYYIRDNLLNQPITVPAMSTNEYQSYLSFSEGNILLFEVEEGQTPTIDYIEFRNGTMLQKVIPSALEYYTVQEYIGKKKKQVYGFTVVAPFGGNYFTIDNVKYGFTINQVYDCYYSSVIGDKAIGLVEEALPQYQSISLKEEAVNGIEEYKAQKLYENVIDEQYRIAYQKISLSESIAGGSSNQEVTVKENVLNAEGYLFGELYRSTLNTPLELERLPVLQKYQCKSREMYFVKASESLIDWSNEAFVMIDFTDEIYLWNDITIFVGLVDNTGKLVKIDKLLNTTIDEEKLMNISRHIKTYLTRNNLPVLTNRIGYIGFKNNNDYSNIGICDFYVRLTKLSSKAMGVKENVLTNVNRVEYPNTFYKLSDKSVYALNQVIPNVAVDDEVYFAILNNLPKRLVVETNTPIRRLRGRYNWQDEYYAVSEPVVKDNKYYYDITITAANPAKYIFITFIATAMQPANPVLYKVELYHQGYTGVDGLVLTDKVFETIPHQALATSEYVINKPHQKLSIEEYVLNVRRDTRLINLREKAISPNAIEASILFALTEQIEPQLSKNHLLLQECIPTLPQKDKVPIYEYILEDTYEDLVLTETVVNPKQGIDGKVMVEIIK